MSAYEAAEVDMPNEMLKELREKSGLTQQALADMCRVSRQTMAAWEHRERPIDLEQLWTLKEALQWHDETVMVFIAWWNSPKDLPPLQA